MCDQGSRSGRGNHCSFHSPQPKYSKLGTEDWFSGNYIEVLDEIEMQIKNLKKNLRMECHEVKECVFPADGTDLGYL